MSGDVPAAASPPPLLARGSQQLRPQSQRYQWEQQWLRENRAASAVIEAGDAVRGAFGQAPTTLSPVVAPAASPANVSPGGAGPGALATHYLPPAGEAPFTAAQPTPVDASKPTAALAVPAMVLRAADAIAAGDAAPQPRALNRYAQDEEKSFAFWRTDDRVQVSMRLQDPARDSNTVLEALRRWLGGAGLLLTRLTVNGRSLWREGAPAPRRDRH